MQVRASAALMTFTLVAATEAAATCWPNSGRFEPQVSVASRPLVVHWELGGACCAAGGVAPSCSTAAPAPGCHPLQRLDELGLAVDEPCLELKRVDQTNPYLFGATRTLTAGAYVLAGQGFIVSSEDAGAPLLLDDAGVRPYFALDLAAQGPSVAVAWGSWGSPLELRVFGPNGDVRAHQLGAVTLQQQLQIAVAPFKNGWLVGAGDRLIIVGEGGSVRSVRSVRLRADVEALATRGRGGEVVLRNLDGGVSLVAFDARGKVVGPPRTLPAAQRWELLSVDGGLLAAGLNGAYPASLLKVLPDGTVVKRGSPSWGFQSPRVGTTPNGFVLYDSTHRQELDLDLRASEALPGGLLGPRDGPLGLERDQRVEASFARAADAPGPRVLVEGLGKTLQEPRVVALADRTLVVAWLSPEGPRLTRVRVPEATASFDAGVEERALGCREDPNTQCGLHPFGPGCRRLVCGPAVLESALAASSDRLWAAVLAGDRQQASRRCVEVLSWRLDGGTSLPAELPAACVGSASANHLSLSGPQPMLAVGSPRGVTVFDAATSRQVLDVPGARDALLVGSPRATLLLVEQDASTIDAHLVGKGRLGALFEAPVRSLAARPTAKGFVVMATVGEEEERAVVRFVDFAGRAGKPVPLEGRGGWLVPGKPVTRVFYLNDTTVEQTLSDEGRPVGPTRPQVTPAYPVPTVVGGDRYLFTPWSDEHTLELRRLAPDAG